MSQPSTFAAFPMFASWRGVVAASTIFAGLTVLASSPACAQVIGGMGQRSGSTSSAPQQRSAPVVVQSRVYTPNAPVQSRQSYPQPVYPQSYSNNAPIYQRSPVEGIFRSSSGGGMQGYTPEPTPPSQLPNLRPGITYRSRTIMPGVGGRNNESSGSSRRLYSNQLPRTDLPRRDIRRGLEVNNRPIFGSGGIQGSIRITTPIGPQTLPSHHYDNNYLYSPVNIINGPSLLGGYYYGNYCDTNYGGSYCYPSVYSCYPGFPEYIYNPGVIVIGDPYYPVYDTSYLPFSPPVYQVTYNQTNYYVASPDRVQQIEDGGQTARRALQNAYPAGSYQAAFGDIEQAWRNGDIGLLQKHIRDRDTKLSVYFKGKYSYSIASGDFVQITRDAFDRLSTVSFEFTRLRKAKNGDVTAYGKHVYQTSGSSDASNDGAGTGGTVPFSTDGSQPTDDSQPYNKADDPTAGAEKTIYVSYTLRKQDDQWDIIGVDSSPTELAK